MMIEVNLLPAELQRVEHTPLPRFLVVILGTAAIMATGAFGVVVNWRTVPDLKARELAVSEDLGRSSVQAAVYDRLLAQIEETQDRKKAIGEMWRSRIMWSEKLAQLSEMTPNFIGIQDITVSESRESTRAGKDDSGGMLTIGSICAGADHRRVANWRRIVKGEYEVEGNSDPWVGRQFFRSFVDLLPTSTQKVEVKDYVEKEALKFGLKMPVKTASVRLDEAMAAAREDRIRRQGEPRVPVAPRPKTPDGAKETEPAGTTGVEQPTGGKPEGDGTATAPTVREDAPAVKTLTQPETRPEATAPEPGSVEGNETDGDGKAVEGTPAAPTETSVAPEDKKETTGDVEKEATPDSTKPREDAGRKTGNEDA
ncbi:MAG TPA: hypothetical protein VMZ92_06745 [Planctomycetota bacterium]|nr:hypothetical protein [Planctomycetota bacterium]